MFSQIRRDQKIVKFNTKPEVLDNGNFQCKCRLRDHICVFSTKTETVPNIVKEVCSLVILE